MRIDSSFNQYQGVMPQNTVQQRDTDGDMDDLGNILKAASYQQNNVAMKLARIASQQMAKLTGLGQNFDNYA